MVFLASALLPEVSKCEFVTYNHMLLGAALLKEM